MPMESMTLSSMDLRAALVADEAKKLACMAQDECPAVEARLKFLCDRIGAQMIGLEFKIKPQASLERKMAKMWDAHPDWTIQKLINEQYDVLRFTMLIPTQVYTEGVQRVLHILISEEGCQKVEEKNYWLCHTYRGINTIYRTKNGMKFELQFHTPDSFDQKQFKTHLLYEALRKAENPVTQNVYFMDMMSLWDMVPIPPGVEAIGTITKQEIPKQKHVTEQEKAAIQRICTVRQLLRDHVKELQTTVSSVADQLTSLILYICTLNHVTAKNLAKRVKGALHIRRKVEEEARRLLGNPDGDLETTSFPTHINGHPIEAVLKELCLGQSDAIRYKIICEESRYFDTVCSFLEILTQNMFRVDNVDNYWSDHEKHNAVTVTIAIPDDNILFARYTDGSPVRFQLQFHTLESFRLSEERKVVIEQMEQQVYKEGTTYNKVSIDMCTRYDARLMRQWKKVQIPPRALLIGKMRSVSLEEVESVRRKTWRTPLQRNLRMQKMLQTVLTFAAGLSLGFLFATRGADIRKRLLSNGLLK